MRAVLGWVIPIIFLGGAWVLVGAADYFPPSSGFEIGENTILHGLGIFLALMAGIIQVKLSD